MGRLIIVSFVLCTLSSTRLIHAQYQQPYQTTTPVPILKQIDRHNEDGSYSYGYEAADGSFKIESKYPTGEVYGKYGFVDDTGKVREVEYGASRRGFEPAGTDINVPPSTIQGNTVAGPNDPEDDGQYREDPSVYYTDPKYTNGEYYRPIPKRTNYAKQPNYEAPEVYNPAPQRYDTQSSVYNIQTRNHPAEQQQYQSQYQQQDHSADYRYQGQGSFQYLSDRFYNQKRRSPQTVGANDNYFSKYVQME
ncbi:uncharacterized protein LOC124182042 [Neodiprion fabricii]|uniref:uncharacterized protein LOC124182042 n=1 Tax=Neodiprion fabricii TaxID=2872261 RepID=UPI001ED97D22|nr:uncharacterized protein LOC124182042 [Neodiprion fabricii]